jgi:hypothetical protein
VKSTRERRVDLEHPESALAEGVAGQWARGQLGAGGEEEAGGRGDDRG